MNECCEISFIRSFKEEVGASVKEATGAHGWKKVADHLGFGGCYIYDVGNRNLVSLRNLNRAIKALGMANSEYYYAAVVPYGITNQYDTNRDLFVFSCKPLSEDNERDFGKYCTSEIFEVSNNLYRDVLRYWRKNIYRGDTIVSISDKTCLSDRTVSNALHQRLSPKCSTIQKLLSIYGKRLIILKTPHELSGSRVKMIY